VATETVEARKMFTYAWAAMLVECPECQAAPGEKCEYAELDTKGRKRTGSHRRRHQYALHLGAPRLIF
jgi:hypothetical protein